jgi:predicted amidohydrolase YtcJ
MSQPAPSAATTAFPSTPASDTYEHQPRLADLVIRAGTIYSMAPDRRVYRALAVRDEWIVAASEEPHDLDGLIGDGTTVVDDPNLTVLPTFIDTHHHFSHAIRNLGLVEADRANSIAELIAMIRQDAATKPAGAWVLTSDEWNESNLAEEHLPRAAELDQATRDHPVWVKRGGHIGSANSLALQLAGITRATPDPPGGRIERTPDGTPTGVLVSGPAYALVERLIPLLPFEQRVAHLRLACATHNALGIGTIREPIVAPEDFGVFQALWAQGGLTVRVHAMFLVPPPHSTAQTVAELTALGLRSGFGDDTLRIWGFKSLMDGGVEAAALDGPYADNPQYAGTVYWKIEDLVEVVTAGVTRGWRFGIHAVGERAVQGVLDAYEQVLQANPAISPEMLVIEHAILATAEQRARAIRLGIPVTVQHPVVYTMAAEMVTKWGPERAARATPIGAWLNEGGPGNTRISAGSDYPAAGGDPLLALWGMATRGTRKSGILGPEYAIDRYAAVELYTMTGAELLGEHDRLGTLQPGRLADLAAYRADPITCPIDDVPALRPAFTLIGGRVVHDPEELLT